MLVRVTLFCKIIENNFELLKIYVLVLVNSKKKLTSFLEVYQLETQWHLCSVDYNTLLSRQREADDMRSLWELTNK